MTRILVVEADEEVARAISDGLAEHAEWEVTRVASLLEAIRVAGDTPFDAAVLDYDQPDGSGFDVLDFLRIASPGIRILMVSAKGDEQVAFHALSHGVGDLLVKDRHLVHELPRRVDALLDTSPALDLVESLAPVRYEAPPEHAERAPGERETPLDRALRVIVGGPILAAAVHDPRGKPVAVRLPPGVDGDGLGFALATVHGQIGALWTYAELKPVGYDLLVEVDAGLLGVTAIPGTFLVSLLMERDTERARAMQHLAMAARKVHETLAG